MELQEKIIDIVAEELNVSFRQMRLKTRKKHIIDARYLAMYYVSNYTNLTLEEVGEIFNRDHSTVIHAKKKINNLIFSKDKVIDFKIRKTESKVLHAKKIHDKNKKFDVFCELLEKTNENHDYWINRYKS